MQIASNQGSVMFSVDMKNSHKTGLF